MKDKVLVVGGDSKIAKFLIKDLKKNFHIISTTRRKKTVSRNKIFLDLVKLKSFILPKNISYAIILAGIDGHKKCSENYKYSYLINSVTIPKLMRKLISNKIFVCFVNTSAVFTSSSRLPKENAKYTPSFGYGAQKAIAERKIIKFVKRNKLKKFLSILRITKNVDIFTEVFSGWIKKINKREKFHAFKDLYFSPISFHDTTRMLHKIIKKKIYGIYHLSGERDISYASFAKKLLQFNNIDSNLVNYCHSYEKKIKLAYNNPITGLDMKKTSKITKIKPIKIKKILKLLSSKIN